MDIVKCRHDIQHFGMSCLTPQLCFDIYCTGGTSQWQQASEISGKWVRSSVWNKRLPGHSLHAGEVVPGPAGEEGCQAAEGAAAAGPQSALQPGHLRAAHQGGSEEARGGTA